MWNTTSITNRKQTRKQRQTSCLTTPEITKQVNHKLASRLWNQLKMSQFLSIQWFTRKVKMQNMCLRATITHTSCLWHTLIVWMFCLSVGTWIFYPISIIELYFTIEVRDFPKNFWSYLYFKPGTWFGTSCFIQSSPVYQRYNLGSKFL